MLGWAITFSLIVGTVLSQDTTSSPGCSFIGNQCMYTVKLGHSGQCDNPPTTAPTSSGGACCDDLTNKYSQLKDDLEQLNIKVSIMTSTVASSNQNATLMETELRKAMKARDDIVAVLNRKESELNSSKAELAKVMANAAQEIQNLRSNLTAMRSTLSTCQTALGGTPISGDTTAIQPGDYDVTYFSFNEDPNFTYTKSPYGQLQLTLQHHGSNTLTGPKVEHTWGIHDGRYLGLSAYQVGEKMTSARQTTLMAESDTFPPANAYCIMFYYYMEGKDVKTLTVNAKINGGTGYPLWTRTGPSSTNKWQLVKVELDSEYSSYPFKIDFTMTTDAHRIYHSGGYVPVGYFGDIAVDDLYVYNTTCASIAKYPPGAYQNTVNNVTSYYTFHATPMTWKDAYDACRQTGPWSALVSIQTDEEQAFLVNTIKHDVALNTIGQNGFYTSGTDVDDEHRFAWTNTGIPITITNSHWQAGQPNNVAGNQDCLLMQYPNNNYKWGDVACETKHPFICEVEIDGSR